jgi:hypothetical protein
VVEVLVLLLLHLAVRLPERPALLTRQLLGGLADQLPVHVVLRLRLDDALGGDELRRCGIGSERGLHGRNERLTLAPHDLASRRIGHRIETERVEDSQHDDLVVACLVQVRAPFLLQVVVAGTPDRGLVDPDSPALRLERLVQEFVELLLVHRLPSIGVGTGHGRTRTVDYPRRGPRKRCVGHGRYGRPMRLVEMTGPGGAWRVLVPETRRERMRGLRGHPPPGPREAMLLHRCRSIHTFGLRRTITVAFLDPGMEVLEVHRCPRGRIVRAQARSARHALECAEGCPLGIGDRFSPAARRPR